MCAVTAWQLYPIIRAGLTEYYNYRYKGRKPYKEYCGEVRFYGALFVLGAAIMLTAGAALLALAITGKIS